MLLSFCDVNDGIVYGNDNDYHNIFFTDDQNEYNHDENILMIMLSMANNNQIKECAKTETLINKQNW